MTSSTVITAKGQITIPAALREELELRPGERLEVEREGDQLIVRRAISVTERTAGALAEYARPELIGRERELFEIAVAEDNAAATK